VTAYEELLESFRAKYDLWPWMEVTNKWMPAGSAGSATGTGASGAQALLSMQRPYDILWDKMPFSAWDIYQGNNIDIPGFTDMSFGAGVYNWQMGAGSDLIQQSQYSVIAEDLVGAYNDAWIALPKGAHLPKNEMWQGYWTLGPYYNVPPPVGSPTPSNTLNGFGLVTQSLRGYRLREKGSSRVPQLTREELLQSGKYRLRAYSYAAVLTAQFGSGATPGTPAQLQTQFNAPADIRCDFLCHRVRFRPQFLLQNVEPGGGIEAGVQNWIYTPNVGLQDADQNLSWQGGYGYGLQNGPQQAVNLTPWTHWLGVDWTLPITASNLPPIQRVATQWNLPVPLTIHNAAQYNVTVQCPGLPTYYENTYQVTLEVILEGELIIPK
jgi:hypothetical protein